MCFSNEWMRWRPPTNENRASHSCWPAWLETADFYPFCPLELDMCMQYGLMWGDDGGGAAGRPYISWAALAQRLGGG